MQEKPTSPCLIQSLGKNLKRVEEDLHCRNIWKTGEVEEGNKRARGSGDEKEVAMAVMDIMTCSAPFFFTLSRRLSTHPSAPESRFSAPHSLPRVFSPIVSSHSNWAPFEQQKKKREKGKSKRTPLAFLRFLAAWIWVSKFTILRVAILFLGRLGMWVMGCGSWGSCSAVQMCVLYGCQEHIDAL